MELEDLAKYERTYVGQNIRRAQDYRALFECSTENISADEKKKTMVWSMQFNLGGVYSGVCIMKFIIQESRLDTNATTRMIQTKLSNLDIYICTVGNDITKFHGYVLQLIDT